MRIKLSEVRYLPDSILPPVSTEVCPLPTLGLTMVMVLEATGDATGGSSEARLQLWNLEVQEASLC